MGATSQEKYRVQLASCRPDGDALGCRKTREALAKAASDPALRAAFDSQAAFDAPLSASLRALPLPGDFDTAVQDGLRLGVPPTTSTWRGMLRQPALWAVLLAVAFLAAWGGWALYERAMSFPGDENVRQLVEATLKSPAQFVAFDGECGKLGDILFLRHNLADYEVPETFAREATTGYRVFEKNDTPVAEVQARDADLIFLVFRAEAQGVEIAPEGTWKHLDGDGWDAAVEVQHQICFVAISRHGRAPIDDRLRVARN